MKVYLIEDVQYRELPVGELGEFGDFAKFDSCGQWMVCAKSMQKIIDFFGFNPIPSEIDEDKEEILADLPISNFSLIEDFKSLRRYYWYKKDNIAVSIPEKSANNRLVKSFTVRITEFDVFEIKI